MKKEWRDEGEAFLALIPFMCPRPLLLKRRIIRNEFDLLLSLRLLLLLELLVLQRAAQPLFVIFKRMDGFNKQTRLRNAARNTGTGLY